MINVAIIGATGYVGLECTRLLLSHPQVKITCLVSQSFVGQKFSDIYPNLSGICDIKCSALNIEDIKSCADVAITALPHGASMEVIPELLEAGLKVIDASGDFRYEDKNVYEKWYKLPHTAENLLSEATYGLVELNREKIKKSSLVANPGCYPTCSILGIAPLLKNNLIDEESIIINSVSGVSGAGRKAELSNTVCELSENFKAYGVCTHRHTSEIEQELSKLSNKDIIVSFTPHLAPIKRGMLSTIYAKLNDNKSTEELLSLYNGFYASDFFVRIKPKGVQPEVKFVAGSNFVDIGLVVDTRTNRVIVTSCQDNLCKGASGQIVQNLNVMFGLDEKLGLERAGLYL